MNAPGFWEDESRFETLGEAEYIDRLQAALSTAESLGERLARSVKSKRGCRARVSSWRCWRVACMSWTRRFAVSTTVRRPMCSFVFERRMGAPTRRPSSSSSYRACTRGGPSDGECASSSSRRSRPSSVLAVSGLGSGTILTRRVGPARARARRGRTGRRPDGRPRDGGSGRRRVASWTQRQLGAASATGAGSARDCLAQQCSCQTLRGRASAPLVRDAVRGYRTGRLDRVLAGDFDLF